MESDNNKKIKVALYEPEIAANVGSIMRACSCFSVELILIEPLGFVIEDKKLKRSAMDYDVEVTRVKSYREFFEKYTGRKVLFTPHTSLLVNDFQFEENDILLFGRESNGVELEIAAKCEAMVSIKMKSNCRSLNLAHSVITALQFAFNN